MTKAPPIPPKHVAIIMDGNGRWAKKRSCGRAWGHREGAKRVDEITSHCREIGVRHLTLYAFSTENWNRPLSEVSMLMRLLVQHLGTMDKKLVKNQVRLRAQGTLSRLPAFVRRELDRVIRVTSAYEPKMDLTLCLSYGGRQEIADAARALAEKAVRGEIRPEEIDEAAVARHLYLPDLPEPELLIRTAGEMRVSNFLLWEIAYSEFYVTDTLWPDFHAADLDRAFADFRSRERRFGLTSEQVVASPKGEPAPEVNAP
jgi:undecaprenyl diphosphate synthase